MKIFFLGKEDVLLYSLPFVLNMLMVSSSALGQKFRNDSIIVDSLFSYDSPDSMLNRSFKTSNIPACTFVHKMCGDTINVSEASNKKLVRLFNSFYSKGVGANSKKIYYGNSPSVGIAAATVYEKRHYVLYNDKEILNLKATIQNNADFNWIVLAVVIHEFGHHFNFDTDYLCPSIESERGADDFMGFWMARMKATESDAKLALEQFASIEGDDIYESKARRIGTMLIGYKRGKESSDKSPIYFYTKRTLRFLNERFKDVVPQMDYVEVASTIRSGDSLRVNLNLKLFELDKVDYLIENNHSRQYLKVKQNNSSRVLTLGIVVPSIVPDFNLMVRDQYYQYLYIDQQGLIFSPDKNADSGFTLIGKL